MVYISRMPVWNKFAICCPGTPLFISSWILSDTDFFNCHWRYFPVRLALKMIWSSNFPHLLYFSQLKNYVKTAWNMSRWMHILCKWIFFFYFRKSPVKNLRKNRHLFCVIRESGLLYLLWLEKNTQNCAFFILSSIVYSSFHFFDVPSRLIN